MNASHAISVLISMLAKRSRFGFFVALFFGVLGGLSCSLVIPIIISVFGSGGMSSVDEGLFSTYSKSDLSVLFFLNCFLIFLFQSISSVSLSFLTRGLAADLRINLCKKIPRLSVRSVERIGMPKIINILTRDVQNVASSAVVIPSMFIACITVLAILAYLVYLDAYVFLATSILFFVGVILFVIPMRSATTRLQKARDAEDQLQEGVRGLLLGLKELKLSQVKCSSYINDSIFSVEKDILLWGRSGDSIMLVSLSYAGLVATLVIGVVAFFFTNLFMISNTEAFGVIMVLLYLLSPISTILAGMPNLKLGGISLEKIMSFDAEKEEAYFSYQEPVSWKTISLDSVGYSYDVDENRSLSLKPSSIFFERGRIYYIVGANGSGKTTLAKLLTLHYEPTQGGIFYDSTLVSNENIQDFRQSISSIYSDYYVFERLYGNTNALDESKVQEYIHYLSLDDKVEFKDGRFSNTNLSDGQRRRLALIAALLDDRDFYLFDEWAADQDPKFKRFFYSHVLPDLKSKNKLVVIITHDDRYFDYADTLIFMEDGEVRSVSDQNPRDGINRESDDTQKPSGCL